jgi:PAS domain S-box-containing protein
MDIPVTELERDPTTDELDLKLRAILNATPFPIAIVDRNDERIIFWSRSALSLFGHTAPTASEWYEIAYPDEAYRADVVSRWKPFLEKAQSSGQTVNTGDYRITCRDGSVRICELHACFIADNLIVTFNDITERMKIEDARRNSEEYFEAIFMQVPFGIAVIDSFSGHIYKVNQQFADIAGRSMQEMSNIDWMQITHPDDVQADLDQMALLNTGTTSRFKMEKRYLHPDGKAVWIHMTVIKLNSTDISHPRHFCIVQDITERKQFEAAQTIFDQQLRDYQFYTRSLLESSVDAFLVCDVLGIVTDVNKQMEALSGRTRDELIGAPFKNCFTDPTRAEAVIKRVLVERKVTDYELTVCNLEGKQRMVSFNASTFYDRNRSLMGVFAEAREVPARNAPSTIEPIKN